MLQPKRLKFRKVQKGRNRGLAHRGNKVSFGEYGLKATGRGRVTARQIEPVVVPSRVTSSVAARSGSGSSPTSRFPRSRWKSAWVRVRLCRVLGRTDPARPCPVRDRRRIRGAGSRGVQPGRTEVPGLHHLCETDGDVMKAQEIREKSAEQLQEQLFELLREQFNLRMQKPPAS